MSNNVPNVPSWPKLRRGLKVAHLNVNRLYNKTDSIRELLADTSLDILGLSETWLTADILDNEISIQGYSILRRDRPNGKQGGGIVIYVREYLDIFVRNDSAVDDIEAIWKSGLI